MARMTRMRSGLRVARTAVQRVRGGRAAGYSNAGEEHVLARLLATLDAPRFCVDIGAGDGRTMSNVLALYEQGWSGLSVEVDPDAFQALSTLCAKFSEVALVRAKVTPDNVVEIMRGTGVPAAFGVLSLDIDGYDYFVLDEVLGAFRPTVVCTEINEKIPPPLRFTVRYVPEYRWGINHFYGQSICQLATLCELHGYSIVELEYNNAFLVPSELAATSLTPEEAYRRGYRDRPDRRTRFPWNDDMEQLQALSPAAAVEYLDAMFERYQGMYQLDAGDAAVSSS